MSEGIVFAPETCPIDVANHWTLGTSGSNEILINTAVQALVEENVERIEELNWERRGKERHLPDLGILSLLIDPVYKEGLVPFRTFVFTKKD